ncbi:MAG: hypothetical protein OEM07_01315, partial [Gammaproteobacteria bacterium]|nr:hypothetical protein [Gammaproteobacteria bacterium]
EINEINRKLRAKGEVFESRLEDYGMGCGMPYVLVFGPDSSVLAQDGCNKTPGLDLIENWMVSS